MRALEEICRLAPGMPVLVVSGDEKTESVVTAMKAGAYDYLTKPLESGRLQLTLEHAIFARRLALRVRALERDAGLAEYGQVFGYSPSMGECLRQVQVAATQDEPVLLSGEPGTGKSQLARMLHDQSARRGRPFVECSLATTPEPLQAGQIFGYGRGSGRGVAAPRKGLIDQVERGTLLLRDIDELGPNAQANLLGLLERRTFLRVGGSLDMPGDIRLVSTTSSALTSLRVPLRERLRLAVSAIEIAVPPLRRRPDDVVSLAGRFLNQHCQTFGRSAMSLAADAVVALSTYAWPGNTRELSNVMYGAVIASGERAQVTAEILPAYLMSASKPIAVPVPLPRADDARDGTSLASVQHRVIQEALVRHRGNVSAAARELGIGRGTLYRKLREAAPDGATPSIFGAASPGD